MATSERLVRDLSAFSGPRLVRFLDLREVAALGDPSPVVAALLIPGEVGLFLLPAFSFSPSFSFSLSRSEVVDMADGGATLTTSAPSTTPDLLSDVLAVAADLLLPSFPSFSFVR